MPGEPGIALESEENLCLLYLSPVPRNSRPMPGGS